MGHDADTVAAIACTLSGAYHGYATLPQRLVAELEYHDHDLRPAFKAPLLDDEANPMAVEKLVGHKRPAMMEGYWHPNPTLLLETAKRLDRILALRDSPATTGRNAEAVVGESR